MAQRAVTVGGRALGVLAAVAVAALLVLLMTLLDRESVADRSDQRSLDFGLPVAWIHQDQGSLDPPYPASARAVSPWEHPTTVSEGALVLDLLAVLAVIAALGLVAGKRGQRRVIHQMTTPTRTATPTTGFQ